MHCGRRNVMVVLGLSVGLLGCADFVVPTRQYAITHPWDTSPPISRGTTKNEVREVWGQPDAIIPRGVDEMGLSKEEWIYQARTHVPVDIRYFCKTKRILFTGESVTGWVDEAAQDQPTHR